MTAYPKLLTLTIQDAGGDMSPVSIHIGDSNTGGVEDENSFLEDYLTPLWDAIRPLVTGVLVSAKVTVEYPISSFTNNTYDVLSDIEEKVVFDLKPFDPSKRPVKFSLPTVNEAIFDNLGAGKDVDFTNSDVQVFVHIMTHDLDEDGIDVRDSHGNEIGSVEKGISYFKG